jgi:hypothetical protein
MGMEGQIRKGLWRSKIGVGVAMVSVSKGREMGFGNEKPGTVAVPTQLGREV